MKISKYFLSSHVLQTSHNFPTHTTFIDLTCKQSQVNAIDLSNPNANPSPNPNCMYWSKTAADDKIGVYTKSPKSVIIVLVIVLNEHVSHQQPIPHLLRHHQSCMSGKVCLYLDSVMKQLSLSSEFFASKEKMGRNQCFRDANFITRDLLGTLLIFMGCTDPNDSIWGQKVLFKCILFVLYGMKCEINGV